MPTLTTLNRVRLRVETVTEDVLATPRSSRDGMVSPRPSLSGPAVEHLAVQARVKPRLHLV